MQPMPINVTLDCPECGNEVDVAIDLAVTATTTTSDGRIALSIKAKPAPNALTEHVQSHHSPGTTQEPTQ